ncbi:MAG: zinc-ribbon domain-containing protein [Clostridia bacterium]|nr:zinc-ribbon domain-containing protein [Clostridia bacterium]MBN2884051.1 zinc-ribbon domain-containing protein [Clostridia bacterium]
MFCEKCGSEMLDTAKFCPSCGAKAEPVEEMEQVPEIETIPEAEPVIEPEGPTVGAAVEKKPLKEKTPEAPKYGKTKDLTKPLSTASYFGMFFLMALPLIRLISLLVWSFSDNVNVNKKHFAHAVFIWVLVSLILAIVATIVLFIIYGATFYEIFVIW